jgi:hypothetical protein
MVRRNSSLFLPGRGLGVMAAGCRPRSRSERDAPSARAASLASSAALPVLDSVTPWSGLDAYARHSRTPS